MKKAKIDAPTIAAPLNASDVPVYRTSVGNSSPITVPSGPYVTPISPIPIASIVATPHVPAENSGASTSPNIPITMVTLTITREATAKPRNNRETGTR